VLVGITRGKTALDIAQQLHLSRRTVEDYTDRIKGKMFCQTKKELIGLARELNIGYD